MTQKANSLVLPGQPKPASNKPSDFQIVVRCFGFVRPYWRIVASAYISLLGVTILALAIPQFIRWIVDVGIGQGDLRVLTLSVIALLVVALLRGGLQFLVGRWSEIASQSVAYDVRNLLHRKLTELSFGFHDRSETGQLLSRGVQDVDRIRFLTGRAILRLVQSMGLAVGTAIVLFGMSPTLALVSMVTIPLLAWRGFAFGREARPLSLRLQQQLAELTTKLDQNLRGSRIVKAFAQEERESQRFREENDRWFRLSARLVRLSALNIPLMDLIANLGLVFIIWYGGLLTIRGDLTLGELVAFTTYLGMLVQPVRRMGMIIPAFAMAIASGERVFEILDTPRDVENRPDAAPLPPLRGHVRFEHVSFSYQARQRVLHEVSFEAQPGQVIALLGATGSGKSSIINLIPRFYDPSVGCVTIDGYDLREVDLRSLRDQIGMVLQDTTLFAETVRENIAFGHPDADDEAIMAAAKAAQADDFIQAMPEGYDTEVGERGVTLSGGQKQRLSIARALLKDPRILILDDATSSVDTETERQIQTALAHLMQGRTSFVIAQRLSTVRMADLILVLDQGRIATAGTHNELLVTSPLYAELCEKQLVMGNGGL